ncbi:MAG: HAMP domain-containing protein [Candidatus Bathyarchaeia archaeon]|jgi:nitrogen fixation/metabolism regulation signal transduction histidine kinase
MKIRQKLLISYLILVALFVVAGAATAYNTSKMQELETQVKMQVDINNNAYAYAQGLDQKQFGTIMYTMNNPQQGEQIMVNSAEIIVQAQENLQADLADDPELLAKFNEVVNIDKQTVDPAITKISEIINSNSLSGDEQVAQTWAQITILMNAVSQADNKLAEVRTTTMNNVAEATSASQNYAAFSTILAVVFIGVTAGISVVLALTIGNRITLPLKKLVDIAHKVSLGDMTQRHYLKEDINLKTGDEIDELTDAFRRMINAFRLQEELINEPGAEPTK